MDRPVEDTKTALIKRLARRARSRDCGTKKRNAGTFVEQFFANVAPDDLLAAEEDALLGGALSLWQLMRTRAPGKAKVRVFNPTAEKDGWTVPRTIIEIVNDDMPFLVASITAMLNQRFLMATSISGGPTRK